MLDYLAVTTLTLTSEKTEDNVDSKVVERVVETDVSYETLKSLLTNNQPMEIIYLQTQTGLFDRSDKYHLKTTHFVKDFKGEM